MARARIKICGITEPAALEAAIAARADYVGFNFVPGSARQISLDRAAALGAQAGRRIVRVALLVDPDDAAIDQVFQTGAIDALQLHGDESPARTAQLRARLGLPVWKALPVAGLGDLARAANYVGAADLVLLDAKTPEGTLTGGQGLRFDWTLLQGWKAPLPWGLAGGLDPANVGEAIRLTGAALVDAASGVESAPGVKDPARIAAFCDTVRTA